jgi:hypothetical protein
MVQVDDATLAGDAWRRLAQFLGRGRLALRLPDSGPADEPIVLPPAAVEELGRLLASLAAESSDLSDIADASAATIAEVWGVEDFSDWESTDG